LMCGSAPQTLSQTLNPCLFGRELSQQWDHLVKRRCQR
jgi:hypothetical protein